MKKHVILSIVDVIDIALGIENLGTDRGQLCWVVSFLHSRY